MTPGTYNMTIVKGATEVIRFEMQNPDQSPLNLTGFTITASCGVPQKTGPTYLFSFVVDVESPATNGVFTLTAPEADTAAISPNIATGAYDVRFEKNGEVFYYVRGSVTFVTPVTTV